MDENNDTGFRFKISGGAIAGSIKTCGLGLLGWVCLFCVDEIRSFYRDRTDLRQRIIALEQTQR